MSTTTIKKNINRNLSDKYSQNLLDHTKQSTIDVLKTSYKKVIQKTAQATADLIGNKISDKITKISKTSQENNSETTTNDHGKEIPKERYMSPDERQNTIDDLRLI